MSLRVRADVKPDWRAESLGWFGEGGELAGVGLVLYRPLHKALDLYMSRR
ncbi:hypothetical protein [Streptomyces sp. SID13726]|nr:hypothetical protein [Streptomyces sp. SID13726]NEB04971.1 hypothetical protein [Streptomyces sp. SID13726]